MASPEKGKVREVEEEEEKEKEEGEAQEKKMVDKVRRKLCKSVHLEEERGCERKRKQKGKPGAPT